MKVTGANSGKVMRISRCPGAGAVNDGDFVKIARDGLQARQIQHHVEAGPLPNVDGDDRSQRGRGIAEPGDGSDSPGRSSSRPALSRPKDGIVYPGPEQPDHHEGQGHRQEERRAEENDAAQLLVDQQALGTRPSTFLTKTTEMAKMIVLVTALAKISVALEET